VGSSDEADWWGYVRGSGVPPVCGDIEAAIVNYLDSTPCVLSATREGNEKVSAEGRAWLKKK
jgi:hypothetical protein